MRHNNNFSSAQNNKFRLVEKIFEPLLDKILDKKLTPNEISFLGLEKVIQGIQEIEKGNKFKGFWHYILGNLTDILDGIRSRQRHQENIEIPGQLVDGFCDRAREFYQMFKRGSFIPAISCLLPSIARAKAESEGIIVKERDEKGGSAWDRNILLIKSLVYSAWGNDTKSLEIDGEIYERNMATYKNRLRFVNSSNLKRQAQHDSAFKNHAIERFLLYVQLLQEANKIIENGSALTLVEYMEWQKKYTSKYLKIDVKELRKKYGFKNYKELSLTQIIIFPS